MNAHNWRTMTALTTADLSSYDLDAIYSLNNERLRIVEIERFIATGGKECSTVQVLSPSGPKSLKMMMANALFDTNDFVKVAIDKALKEARKNA